MPYPSALNRLIAALKKLPGIGQKSAERFAFKILDWPETEVKEFVSTLEGVKKSLSNCNECNCLVEANYCPFCKENKRDKEILCIVSSSKDLFALEEARIFKGLYHVLGTVLSPLDNKFGEDISLDPIVDRIKKHSIKEVILALDSTLEGDATALFIKNALQENHGIRVSRLALGLPVGSTLDFVDGGTLARAFVGRSSF